jgi:hypothetical protein
MAFPVEWSFWTVQIFRNVPIAYDTPTESDATSTDIMYREEKSIPETVIPTSLFFIDLA